MALTHIPLLVKKIGIKALLVAMKGLVSLTKGIKLLFCLFEKPINWLWKAIFRHLATSVFASLVQFKKSLSSCVGGGWLSGLFTHKHALTVAIVVLASSVVAGNIHAINAAPEGDNDGQRNAISYFTVNFEDDLLVEIVDEDTLPAQEMSHLDGLALSPQDVLVAESRHQSEELMQDMMADEDSPLLAVSGVEVGLPAVGTRPSTRTTVIEYEVQSGDTVEVIAIQFGLKTATIISANGLNSRGFIKPGQKLKILPVDGILYTTKKGDTVTKIAKTYYSDAAQIAEFNGLADWGTLTVGTQLVLPGGRLPPPPAPVRTTSTASSYVPTSPVPSSVTGKLLWPAGCTRISQYYKRGHNGLDIACPMRTPIYAAEDGIVVFSGWNSGGYGNMIVVDHGGGFWTRYAHATKLLVKAGDPVKRGDVIMLMGSTGRSTGSHLHFEVMKGSTSRRYNPLDYLR